MRAKCCAHFPFRRDSRRDHWHEGLRAPLLEHFAEHLPEAAGYSLVQLIETSAITGHFCDRSGDAYIDILSCKDFAAELAVEVVRAAFRPQHINFMTLMRQATHPRASYTVAAEYVLSGE